MTVASTIVPLRFPPATTLAPLPTASAISSSIRSAAPMLTSEPRHDMAARIAARQRGGALGQLVDERVRDLRVDDEPLGRHADLALVGERAEHRGVDRRVDIGVVEHDQRRLAAELEQDRLQVLRRQLGDHLADLGRAGEVDPLDRGMGDQRRHDLRRVVGRVGDHVDDALGKAGVVHGLADQAMGRAGRLPTT